MLMVFVLLLGLMPSAYAATNEGTQPATEPAATEETAPESAEVPTDAPSANEEDLKRWAELEAQLPAPIEEYFPFAPEIKYPYGEPQDNFYPSSLLEGESRPMMFAASPYAVAPAADMTAIPDEMYDNSILRALEYTGYDVQWLKDNGYLYVAEYVSSNINSYRPEVLSNIGYDDYSPFLNGDETVSNSGTATGKAPDIAKFEANGLVCASFVSYYINNYLPNIEGVDTSHIHEAIKATTMNGGSYSTASVWSWETGLTNLANTPGSGVTKYTDEATAYANIVPGDIIVFSRDDELVHVAIYAGTYDMWNIRGTNRGEKHFLIHVGNSRGPEISTTEYLAKSGTAKQSVATSWYHLELGSTVEETGFIEIYKEDPNGNDLSGAKFKAVDQSTGDTYYIGPTNSNGYAKSGELPLGTYVVTETVFPANYEASGTSTWTVTLTEDTPDMTITINAVNKLKTGYIEVSKADEDGSPLAGAVFTAVNQSTGVSYTIGPTNSNGKASAAVPYGTYTVTETVFPDGFEASGTTSWTVTINDDTPNGTVSVSAVNKQKMGYIAVSKEDEDGSPLAGAVFTAVNQSTGASYTIGPTDSNGEAQAEVPYGTYVVTETVFPDGFEASGTTTWTVTINDDTPNETVTVEAVNRKVTGSIKVWKATTTGEGVELGWPVNLWRIEDDGTWTFIGSGVTKQDKNDPTYTFTGLSPGRYVVQEDPSASHSGYILDTEYHEVEVVGGNTAEVTITNTQTGKGRLVKQTNTGEDLGGRKINLYSDEALTQLVDGSPFVTPDSGTLDVELLPGDYWCVEVDESDVYPYWEFDTEPKKVTIKAGETSTVTFQNTHYGRGKFIKNMPDGGSVAGWVFDLYRAEDGTYMGSYTSGEDGTIVTDLLLPGDYTVYEQIPDDSLYYCEDTNPQTITVVADQTAEVTFTNRLKPAEIVAYKVNTLGEPLPGVEFQLLWSVDGTEWAPVTYTNSQYVTEGTCTSEGITDGKLISGADGIVRFSGLHPERLYKLIETKTVSGYELLAGPAFEGSISVDDDLVVELTVVNVPVYELPMTGSKSPIIMAASLSICLGGCISALIYLRRKKR